MGIYSITNKINGMKYIGSGQKMSTRRSQHLSLLKKNSHFCSHLQYAFDKHGVENFIFEVLEIVDNKERLLETEQKWLDKHKHNFRGLLYNTMEIATITWGLKCSPEKADKQSLNWVFVSPSNKIIRVRNMRRFCRENNFPQSHALAIANRGRPKQYKGWIVYREENFSEKRLLEDRKNLEVRTLILISPAGEKFLVKNLTEFCKEKGLDPCSISNVIARRNGRKSHKGWTASKYDELYQPIEVSKG